ncbi:MAG: tetratricopeptide repeat protein, partial [Alphaproteobacteria bacterium]|nr:tetratricopeptide repeat protein [Alphaproteobacteria bacterium]
MAKRFYAVLLISLLFAAPVHADFEDGYRAHERGDYATALSEFRPLAEAGNVDAQRFLGMMYFEGRGVPKDIAEGEKWLRKAASQGDPELQEGLAQIYAQGAGGVAQDYAEAAKWNRKAAEQGHVQAQHNLAVMLLEGMGVARDVAEAEIWYQRSAEQGDVELQVELA